MPTTCSINPFDEQLLAEYELFTEHQIDQILDRVSHAQSEWGSWHFEQRAEIFDRLADLLEDRQDDLARLCTAEMGKLLGESRSEVEKCAWVCRHYAEYAEDMLGDQPLDDDDDKRSFVTRQPLGVVLAIMPWNFPYWQAFRCAAPAIMAGNALVLKHAGNVSGCALAMEELFREAGAPANLFRVVITDGPTASDMIGDPRIAAASLTGSDRAGEAVGAAAGKHLKPSVLELGGSDAFVVLDLDEEQKVMDTAVRARFMNSGQSCIAAKRFIVVESVYERFVEGFVSRARQLGMGDPTDSETGLAPLAREDLRADLHAQVEDARKRGAEVLIGGDIPSRKGYFYPSTVLANVPREARAWHEELFGPVASLFKVANAQEAIELANDSPFGLGGSVWSGDVAAATEVARGIAAGAVYVNRQMASDPRLPFGGIKRSGYGRELSHLGIREFVNEKTISVKI